MTNKRLMIVWTVLMGSIFCAGGLLAGEGDGPKRKVHYQKKVVPDPTKDERAFRWVHAPFRQNECSICHVSANREKPGNLRAPANTLCLSCHKQIASVIDHRPIGHKPVQDDCTNCHDPHRSDYRLLLYSPPQELCAGCHREEAKLIESAVHKHDAVVKGNTCRNCHNVHGSSFKGLLLGKPAQVCLECHGADSLVANDGSRMVNIEKTIDENDFHHEPINKGDCSECHQAHGGSHYRLLNEAYPHGLYAEYKAETYALCISCHTMEESLSAERTTLTGFRDGERNLHALHLKQGKRGRTCRTCHGEHATSIAHLMRESVPFGGEGWKLSVNFIPSATGGRCIRSCHDTKSYNNGGGFVLKKIQKGGAVPNMELATLNGGTSSVLDPGAAVNLFVFFRPGQKHSDDALNILSRTCGRFQNKSIHCTAIVSNSFSKDRVLETIGADAWDASRTLVDQDDKFYKELGLYLNPSVWVVDSTNSLIEYEPYISRDFERRLVAIVAHQLGEIDDVAFQRVLTPIQKEVANVANRADLNLGFARTLYEKGNWQSAIDLANRAIDVDPTAAPAYSFVGRVYAEQGQCELAIPYLNEALSLDPKDGGAQSALDSCK